MDKRLQALVAQLNLEPLEVNLFRGQSRDVGSAQVFGGQVLGQALAAAYRTVEDRAVHSLHAYFLRRGDQSAPIVYEVDRQRDGGSFSNRRVMAIQHGRPILNMAASFQAPEAGLSHGDPMPQVPEPDALTELPAIEEVQIDRLPEKLRRFLVDACPFEFRPVQAPNYLEPEPAEGHRQVWFRAVDRLPDDAALHQAMLAYASDYGLLTTAMLPHGVSMLAPALQLASLDHAMWFLRPLRVDEWLLYDVRSPSAGAGRGLARGQIFDASGQLVAWTVQEGLMRLRSSAGKSG